MARKVRDQTPKSGNGEGEGQEAKGSEDGEGETDTYTDDRGEAGTPGNDADNSMTGGEKTDGSGMREAGGHSDAGDSEAPNLPGDFADKMAAALGNEGAESGLLDNNEAMTQSHEQRI